MVEVIPVHLGGHVLLAVVAVGVGVSAEVVATGYLSCINFLFWICKFQLSYSDLVLCCQPV